MSIQKWGVRFPPMLKPQLLLLQVVVVLLSTIVPVRLQDSCTSFNAGNTDCQDHGGFLQNIKIDGDCIGATCFPNDTHAAKFTELLNLKELTPVITHSGPFPNQVGMNFNLTCKAWGVASKELSLVSITAQEAPALPDPIVLQRIHYITGGSVTRVASVIVLPMQLTADRHKQNLTCSMQFTKGSTATGVEKARKATDNLYAFKQTKPEIRGSKEVEAGTTFTWECVTEEVTVDNVGQYRVKISTQPGLSIQPDGERHYEPLSDSKPLKIKMTRTIKFKVPASFMPAFFVQCQGENTVLPKKVVMSATALRVAVIDKPLDLSSMFTIIGVSCGLGGFALGIALVVYYCRKKGNAPAKAEGTGAEGTGAAEGTADEAAK